MKPTAIAFASAWVALSLVCGPIPAAAAASNEATIAIVAGTYGSNCGAPHGNVTRDLAEHCDGLLTCNYPVSMTASKSGSCRNDYLAEWRCGSEEFHNAALAAGVGKGDRLILSCVPSSGAGH
ncbi:hypothetical protein [Paraburkholderia sp. J7]|uniref:hypothetical protein n=1 Tax=Paraburkholderia sp. J7 TaxID=2805438 RepID=UPI002AB7708E|nr:hypothetical protein [Paraburkholderia sp. J7]